MQKAADEAHGRVRELKDTYGRPMAQPWSPAQTETYEKAWQDWWKFADEVQAAGTKHAEDEGKPRYDVEAAVRTKARHPEPEPVKDVAT
ncbi:hypothetical protein ACF07Y_39220 [Streptomyces sp. NPDC016566]|uniref:hypothetical protein n=1 Tax=Streptomyces sp. NPDC016566 TaxID=3364967 RepID=UPI0036F734E9